MLDILRRYRGKKEMLLLPLKRKDSMRKHVPPKDVIENFTDKTSCLENRKWGERVLENEELSSLGVRSHVCLQCSLCLDCLSHTLYTRSHPFLVSPFLYQLGRIDSSFSGPSLYVFHISVNMLLNFNFISCCKIQESRSLVNSK